MDYILAIDETGSFDILDIKDESYACGVLIEKNKERQLYESFKEAHSKFDKKNKGNFKFDNFHFSEHIKSNERKENICREILMPYVKKIYISKGKPYIFANMQNWWQISVLCIIKKAINELQADDTLIIKIDPRAMNVLGIDYDTMSIKEEKENTIIKINENFVSKIKIKSNNEFVANSNGTQIEFDGKDKVKIVLSKNNCISVKSKGNKSDSWHNYHNIIKLQFQKCLNNKNVTGPFFSGQDQCVALADIACGFVRKEREKITQEIVECSCLEFGIEDNPYKWIDKDPEIAAGLLFQEITNKNYTHAKSIKIILASLDDKNDKDQMNRVWAMFYDLVKYKIEQRELLGDFEEKVINKFKHEFKLRYFGENIKYIPDKFNELMNVFVEFYSHYGCTRLPFELEDAKKIYLTSKDDGRAAMRWTKYVSFILHSCQMPFNAYDFESTVPCLEETLATHRKVVEPLLELAGGIDENTTALLGSIGQSYAFREQYDEAEKYFNESLKTTKRTNRTYSFLFAIAHRNKNLPFAHKYFKLQTGVDASEFCKNENFSNAFNTVSYCKLRALELYINKTTQLDDIDIRHFDINQKDYAVGLALKWLAVGNMLENPKLSPYAEKLLENSIKNLQMGSFTEQTLALSAIQCFAYINPENEYCLRYQQFIKKLMKQSESFAKYMKQHREWKVINKDADLWDRAMFLPFYYA